MILALNLAAEAGVDKACKRLRKKLRKAGLLNFGNNRFPFFVYNDYNLVSVENIMMIHTMKYIYKCKYDEIKLNLPHYKVGLESLSSVCY